MIYIDDYDERMSCEWNKINLHDYYNIINGCNAFEQAG